MRVALWTLGMCLGACSAAPSGPPPRPLSGSRVSPQDRFVEAAARGDFGEVDRRLLARDIAIDGLGGRGTTALLAAIDHGETAMAKRLLDGGASADREAAGRLPLVASADAAVGAKTIVAALLAAGADPNRADPAGRRALTEHAREGHRAAVELLLTAGAEVDTADARGVTPLHAAATKGHAAVVEQLLAAGAIPGPRDPEGATPLFRAAEHGQASVVELLLEAGAEANQTDGRGRMALGAALAGGHHGVARKLLQTGASPDARIWPPEGRGLVVVATRGDVEGAALLRAAGASLTAAPGAFTPLMAAARAGRVAMVRWLLSRDASPTAVDTHGQTALHVAAAAGQATIVRLLVEAGADASLRDAKGRRPADLARENGHARVLEALESRE